MRISNLRVSNYRCLKEVSAPLSHFTTIIGENSCGKSSLLQALSLLLRGSKLPSVNYYDRSQDIVLDASFEGLSDTDLENLADEHRERIRQLAPDGKLRLLRRYATDGTSELRCMRSVPREARFQADQIANHLRGLAGTRLRVKVEEVYPEVLTALETGATVTAVKQHIEQLIRSLPVEDTEYVESALPTGIENSIKVILPEPVYVPAVRDLADEVKTRETTSFGRLISILLAVIEPKLSEEEDTFANLNAKLNRIRRDGEVTDNRLDEVREVERIIEGHVRESFPSVSLNLEIPPPEVKTILSSAKVTINDGVEGPIENKGDGIKRAVTFAILRSYVALSANPEWQRNAAKAQSSTGRLLFLFEEPELYLYPTAQMVLFDALRRIAAVHQVVISTHSPIFLAPCSEGTFIKMVKRSTAEANTPPSAKAIPVDLADTKTKDQFQLICFDNNNVAFFADTVVLVEGDSDYICVDHIARQLNSAWDFCRSRVALVRISGKANIARYRDFFQHFGVDVHVIVDLDALVGDFDKLGLPTDLTSRRAELLQVIDDIIKAEGRAAELSGEEAKNVVRRAGWRAQWQQFKKIAAQCAAGQAPSEEEVAIIDALLEPERAEPRLAVLRQHPGTLELKRALLASAREYKVHILEKGSIEDYYPDYVSGPDKPSKAQDFSRKITDPGDIRALCELVPLNGGEVYEFDAIFGSVFSICSI